jgi:hypothetical protein
MQEELNKQTVREFTRIFKNEHNVDGVAHFFDQKLHAPLQHLRTPRVTNELATRCDNGW